MATSRGQRPRKGMGSAIRPEGGGGNHAISSAPSGARSVCDGIPGALPPASGHRSFGPRGIHASLYQPIIRHEITVFSYQKNAHTFTLNALGARIIHLTKCGTGYGKTPFFQQNGAGLHRPTQAAEGQHQPVPTSQSRAGITR